MKRKNTELDQKLIENGWYLTNKRYTGKHSEKTQCYEYVKTSDLRNDGKTYDLFILLDLKRSQIVNYGIKNVSFDYLGEIELCSLRFLHLELRHFVERLTKPPIVLTKEKSCVIPISELDEREELAPMTPEQFDELCKENEK